MKKTTYDRLLSKIDICEERGCWNWRGCVDKYGYGKMRPAPGVQPVKAHRLSYELHIGVIPDYKYTQEKKTMQLLHACDNAKCINPNHLRPGTFHQNMFDRDNQKTHPLRTQTHNTMANLNKVQLIGNLTRDPEIKYTPKGTAVVDCTIATNRRTKNADEQWVDEVTFIDVTVFGKIAENVHQYLKKGRGVYLEGRLKLDSWEDRESGQKRSKLKVIAEDVQFLPNADSIKSSERAKETKTERLEREASEGQGNGNAYQQSHTGSPDEDDIPF